MGCLQSYFKKAQTAALSGVTTTKAEEAAQQEKPTVLTEAHQNDAPPVRPPRSPTTDSGKASATSSPAVSPARSPVAQAVKTKLTTTGEKLPSPILQQAITKAFTDEESSKSTISSSSPIQSGATSLEDKILGRDVTSPVSSESKSERQSFGFTNIKSFGSPVKDLLSEGSKSVSSGLSSAISKAEEIESSAAKSVQSAKSEAESKVSSAKSEITSKVSEVESSVEEAKSQVESFASEATDNAGKLISDAESKAAEIKSDLESQATEAEERALSELDNTISAAESKINEIKEEAESKVDDVKADAEKLVTETISAAENKITEIKEEVNKTVDEGKAEAERALSSAQSQIEEIQTEISSKFIEAENKAEELKAEAEKKVAELKNEAEEKAQEVQSGISSTISAAESKVEDIKNEAETKISKTQNEIEGIQTEVASKITEVENKVEEVKSEAKNLMAEAESHVEETIAEAGNKVDELKSETESQFDDIKSAAEEKITEAENFNTEIQEKSLDFEAEIKEKVAEIEIEVKSQAEELQDAAEEKITETQAELERAASQAESALNEQVEETQGAVVEKVNVVENEFTSVISNAQDFVTQAESEIQSQTEHVENVITDVKTTVDENLSNAKVTFETSIIEVEDEIDSKQEAAGELLSEAQVLTREGEAKIKEEANAVEQKFDLKAFSTTIEEKITDATEVVAAKGAALVEEQVATIESAKDDKEQEIADELERVQKSALEVIENVIAEAESKLESAAADSLNSIDAAFSGVENAKAEITTNVEEASNELQAVKEEVQQSVENVEQVAAEIESAVADASASVVEIISDSSEIKNDIQKESEKALESLQSTAESLEGEIVGALVETKNDIKNAIERVSEDIEDVTSTEIEQVTEQLDSTLVKEADEVVSKLEEVAEQTETGISDAIDDIIATPIAAIQSPEQPSTSDEVSTTALNDEEVTGAVEAPVGELVSLSGEIQLQETAASPISTENDAIDAEHDSLEPEVESPRSSKPTSLLIPVATIDITPATPIPSPSKEEEQGIFDNVKFDAESLIENTQNALNNNEESGVKIEALDEEVIVVTEENGEKTILIETAAALIRQEEDDEPSDSQSSAPIGNEGLGAVSSVVIRYSISEGAADAQGEEEDGAETEGRKAEESLVQEDKEIADTLISAVRNSDESSPIEEASEGQATVSEPVDVISEQTASSKDVPSLEMDDLNKESVVIESIDLSALKESPDAAKGLQKIQEESSVEISKIESSVVEPNLEEDLAVAATKIQASFRGYKTRKALNDKTDETGTEKDAMPLIEENHLILTETIHEHESETHLEPNLSEPHTPSGDEADTPCSDGTLSDVRPHFSDATPTPEAPAEASTPASAVEELFFSSTHVAATPIAYLPQEEEITISPQARRRNLSFSSGECGDVSASLTEPIAAPRVSSQGDCSLSETEAATKIQALFRGHLARQGLQRQREDAMVHCGETISNSGEPSAPPMVQGEGDATLSETEAATKIQAQFRGHRTRQNLPRQRKNSGETLNNFAEPITAPIIEEEEEATLSETEAATKIQAHFRGHRARQNLPRQREEAMVNVNETINNLTEPITTLVVEEEANDTLSETEAATKIQAHFRGHRARQNLPRKQDDSLVDAGETISNLDESIAAPNIEEEEKATLSETEAATKIQAHFRGHRARQGLPQQRADGGETVGNLTEPIATPIVKEGEGVAALSETEAATKIQAHFRGHKARQSLPRQREDAMVDGGETRSSADAPAANLRHSGEFHDSLVLPPALATGLLLEAAGPTPSSERTEAADQQDDSQPLVGLEGMPNNCSEMDFLDKAATRIQATFRGFRTRSDLTKKKNDAAPPASKEDHAAAAKIQAGFRGYKVRKEMKERQQEQQSPLPPATSEEEQSAVKIQAGVRGYLTRQRLKKDKVPPPQPPSPEPSSEEVNNAVLKIQSGFRGYKARQEVKSMRNANK